ncbi:MAG TPA: prepilin-type N-terminal cleavage/methylation domain-containing protein [Balneolales bacterium]|nr:prepilin-type N-terminal cleavage/methylation domain-containing protein [Balneolales bacterium]
MNKHLLRENSGFTLIEVIIAMALTTLLVGFAFGIYLFGENYFVRWQRRMRAEDQIQIAAQAISSALYHAHNVLPIKPHAITVESRHGRSRTFWLHHHRLMADSLDMMSIDVPVVDFQCRSNADSSIRDSSPSNQSTKAITTVTFVLSASIQGDTLAIERAVHLRMQSYWDPIKN